jgi:broad specificity phosphatase PhoE
MRPFLLSLSFFLAVGSSPAGPAAAQTPTTDAPTKVLLVRHAERSPGEGDVSISGLGRDRAQALAQLLRDTDVDAIITSQMIRTKETAGPLAQAKRLTPEALPADRLDAVVERIRSLRGQTVLIVHHSNTVPVLVEKLGGPTTLIRDDEFDRLVILTLPQQGPPSVVTLRYGAPSVQ